jgi:NTE family protein
VPAGPTTTSAPPSGDPSRPPASEDEAKGKYGPLPKAKRKGIGLCLSGGGFRATLFHLGALRRLNELGVLSADALRTVASVSGGSIAAAKLADALTHVVVSPGRPIPSEVWDREVRDPLRAFTTKDVRTAAVLKRLLPWNVWRSEATVDALAARYERDLTRLRLGALPARPEFLFLATDMAYGVAWVFSRGWMGDYQVGYMPPPSDFPLARAVAASACFPPLFGPLRLRVDPAALRGGSAARGPARDACLSDLRLTDGGDYDNMGLEPVWKNHAFVLVSDAGGLFTNESDGGLLWRVPRYRAIQERQARGLRKRWLIASFSSGVLEGAYWAVGSAPGHYGAAARGYSKELAREVIAEIRTDLDAFSDAEAAVLENHGYLLADAALRRHMPSLVPEDSAPTAVPHPDWMPPARGEDEIRRVLRDSAKRKTFGRG